MNGCYTCQGVCDTGQSFCKVGKQVVSDKTTDFDFGQCVSAGQILLTRDNWNKIITYINNAYAEGRVQSGGPSGLPRADTNTVMTAEMFNLVSTALVNLGRVDYPKQKVNQGDVIYGYYFENLENYANRLKYKYDQCDNCNIDCNVTCDSCNCTCLGSSQARYCCSACEEATVVIT